MILYNMWPTVSGFFCLVQCSCSSILYHIPAANLSNNWMLHGVDGQHSCFDKTAMDIAVSESMWPVLSTLTFCQSLLTPELHYIHPLEQKHTRYNTFFLQVWLHYGKQRLSSGSLDEEISYIDKGSLALIEEKRWRYITCEVYIFFFLRNGPYIRMHIPICIKLESQ